MSIKNTKESKNEVVAFRTRGSTLSLLDRIAEEIHRKTGVRPNRSQLFEAAVEALAAKHGCK